ncbi:MAG TPA: regulatory protein RecX, partial [Dehalococcoidia bacterium]|nr:regulatory protein RecX [Dehalococcoidia bacterium]
LSLEVLAQSGLRAGDGLDAARLDDLRHQEARHDALASALRLLSYRPRSEAELRQRLARRGAPPPIVQQTIDRLRELGLVDDEGFARSWVESRDQASPRSRRLLASELRAKGVARPDADTAVASVDDEDAAYRAGQRRARTVAGLPWPDFQRRLSGFLLRRGFGYETVRTAVARLWQETAPAAAAGADEAKPAAES